MEKLSMLLMIMVLLLLITAIVLLVLRRKGRRLFAYNKINDQLFKKLAQKSPVWEKSKMIEAVYQIYEILRKAYNQKATELEENVITVNLYQEIFKSTESVLKNLSLVARIQVKNVEIVKIVNTKKFSKGGFDYFIARLEYFTENSTEPKYFYWKLSRRKNNWLLSSILTEPPDEEGYFEAEEE